jgi:hypothetical protein
MNCWPSLANNTHTLSPATSPTVLRTTLRLFTIVIQRSVFQDASMAVVRPRRESQTKSQPVEGCRHRTILLQSLKLMRQKINDRIFLIRLQTKYYGGQENVSKLHIASNIIQHAEFRRPCHLHNWIKHSYKQT